MSSVELWFDSELRVYESVKKMSSVELWFDSEDEEVDYMQLAKARRQIRDASNPLELPNGIFLSYFRVSKDIFKFLFGILDANLKPAVRSSSVLPIIKLAAAMRFFAEGSYQKGCGNDFNVGLAQSTMSKVLQEVVDILEKEICPAFIKFPQTEEEKDHIKMGFFNKFQFPGVIGCIDGTHVKIIQPSKELQHLYYNRKGFYSLNVLLVCDHEMQITFVDANNAGACHDSFIFNASELRGHLENASQRGERNTWLLGDSGYPLKPYLITPFRSAGRGVHNGPNREAMFNRKHCVARSIVERAIGVLKSTFRCTLGARELHYKPENAAKMINVCCALHNLRIKNNIGNEDIDANEIPVDDANEQFTDHEVSDNDAVTARNELMNSLCV